jgi:hypothetical protein
MNLLDLLERHRSAQAKNKRNKVFAFLGLSRQIHGKDAQIVIDYGLSTGKLYAGCCEASVGDYADAGRVESPALSGATD